MSISTCRACGKPIVWIKTPSGKSMPCDSCAVYYKKVAGGSKRIVTPNGEVIACEIARDPNEASGHGYAPHWGSCTKAAAFKKKAVRK